MISRQMQLAEFVSSLTAGNLDRRLLHHARRYLLDYLGVAAFGSTTPWATVARLDAVRWGGTGGRASLIGSGQKTSAHAAAFANGCAAHAFELDDVHDESISHPGVVVYPTVLAVAEAEGIGQDKVLAAVVAGYEMIARVGLATGPWSHMAAGFYPTGTFGVFGAVAACANLLGLDASKTNHAIGIAASFASGTVEFSQTGGQTKRFNAGQAAASGLRAAYLARDGAEGPQAALDGRYGFCQTFSPAPDVSALTEGLGSRYMIDEITVKPYASCSDLHALIEAAVAIREQGVAPGEIACIRGRAPSKVVRLNMTDGRGSIMDAQYSAGFQIAIALTRDPRDASLYKTDLLVDAQLGHLQSLVSIEADPGYDAVYARKIPGSLVIETLDGRSFSHEVETAKGSPYRPMTDGEIEDKFRTLAGRFVSDASLNRVVMETWAFGGDKAYDLLSYFAEAWDPIT